MIALGQGELGSGPSSVTASSAAATTEPKLPSARKGRHVGAALGFTLHAGVGIAAGNLFGREVLFRYCARPAFALERLSPLPDGRFAYELRRPWQPDQTHRILTPLELLARLAALVPPPRHPLIGFHGVFAPHSSWRDAVVPAQSAQSAGQCAAAPQPEARPCPPPTSNPPMRPGPGAAQPAAPMASPGNGASAGTATAAANINAPSETSTPSPRVERKSWWIDWATLLQRVYDFDVLACPCGGRLRAVELVTTETEAREILQRLGLASEPPPTARARRAARHSKGWDPDLDFAAPQSADY